MNITRTHALTHHTHTHARARARTHACTHIGKHTTTRTRTRIQAHTQPRTHVHTYIQAPGHPRIQTPTHRRTHAHPHAQTLLKTSETMLDELLKLKAPYWIATSRYNRCPITRTDDVNVNLTIRRLAEKMKHLKTKCLLNVNAGKECLGAEGLHLNMPRCVARFAINLINMIRRLQQQLWWIYPSGLEVQKIMYNVNCYTYCAGVKSKWSSLKW